MGKNISHETIKALKPGEIAWDGEVKGFGCRCQQDRKIYLLKTRYRGRAVWLTMGDTSDWTPKKARSLASDWKRELRAGVDPDKLRASARGQPTIGELIERYEREHIDAHLKPLTVSTFKGILKRHPPGLGQAAGNGHQQRRCGEAASPDAPDAANGQPDYRRRLEDVRPGRGMADAVPKLQSLPPSSEVQGNFPDAVL